MSSDTITVPSSTTTTKEVLENLRLACIDAADRAGIPKTARDTLFNMCTRVGTCMYRHPDWTTLEATLVAIEAVQRTRRTHIPRARGMLLDVVQKLSPCEYKSQITGTSVLFEGTLMPLGELSDCHRYALHHYANAWASMTGGSAIDDVETRTTWAIKLGLATMASDEKHRALTRETRTQAAAAFRSYIGFGRSPLVFLL